MWSGSTIWGYYATSVILDKSMFCFVNLRGCLRDLGDWTSVWFICSFGLPFSDNWWYFALCKVIPQWFSMVAFSQTRALHRPNECLHWWECVESLRSAEVEKKKDSRLHALEYTEGMPLLGPRMPKWVLSQRWLSGLGWCQSLWKGGMFALTSGEWKHI